jgi:homoserine kinase
VAGLSIVRALSQQELDYEELLAQATSLEGHPDNSAPAIIGGLIAVVSNGDALRPIALHLNEDIGFAFAAPLSTVSTKAARRALPDQVPHEVAARSIARSIALVEGLAEGDADLLRIGFADELHVPFRLGMIAGGRDAIDAAIAAGAWAATVSGSGSGIIAACARGDESAVAHAMARAFERASADEAIGFPIAPDFAGVQLERNP